jgi:hypothetical protein
MSDVRCLENVKCPINRLIGQVPDQPNAPKCSLKFIHRSRVGRQQSEFFSVGESADIVCEFGRGIGRFGLR